MQMRSIASAVFSIACLLCASAALAEPVSRVDITLSSPQAALAMWKFTAAVDSSASDGLDPLDAVAPPPAPDTEVRLAAPSGPYDRMVDVREGSGGAQTWDLEVRAYNIPQPWSAQVTLTWNLSQTEGWTYLLRDLTNGVDTALTPGGHYAFQMTGDPGPLMRLEASGGAFSIPAAKAARDGARAVFEGIVSGVFPPGQPQQCFYVQDAERRAGIRTASTTPVLPGDVVDIDGVLDTVDGERVVAAAQVIRTRVGGPVPQPLFVGNLALCGGAFGLQAAVVNSAVADRRAVGLGNVGLLVRTCGLVTHVDSAGGFFYIDDGSAIDDGSGFTGARVGCEGLTPPIPGRMAIVTGNAAATVVGSRVARLLRPRAQSDIVVLP